MGGGGGYWQLGRGGGAGGCEGGGIGGSAGGGGVPKVGGPVRDPLLPHAYLQGGCVSGGLGVWRDVCESTGTALEQGKSSECRIFTSQQTTFVWRPVLLISRSKHGWFDEREACTKKIGRRWRHAPQPTTSQNPGGGGGSHTRTGPSRPPPPPGAFVPVARYREGQTYVFLEWRRVGRSPGANIPESEVANH